MLELVLVLYWFSKDHNAQPFLQPLPNLVYFRPGQQISTGNNVFTFAAGHPYLQAVLAALAKEYNPTCWACVQQLMGQHVKKIYNVTMAKDIPISSDLAINPMTRYLPVQYSGVVSRFWPEVGVPFDVCRKLFANSSAVHFNYMITNKVAVPDDPQFSAYALLGPRLCPLAYYSSRNF